MYELFSPKIKNIKFSFFVPVSDAKKVRVTGRGVQATGVRVQDVADFKIHMEKAGEGTPEVRVIGPG